jgi:ABC-type proline/glycine betaine transport system permease subunit
MFEELEWNGIFVDVGRMVRRATNDFVEFLVITYGDQFEAFSNSILWHSGLDRAAAAGPLGTRDHPAHRLWRADQPVRLSDFQEQRSWPALSLPLRRRCSSSRATPPSARRPCADGMAVGAGTADHRAHHADRLFGEPQDGLVIAMGVAMYVIGAFDLWDQAMQTIAIMLVSILISVVIGVPVGVIIARSNRTRAVVNPVLDLMQTIPSFVYLIPAVMLFGLGKVPAIIATVIYAVPPLIRLTDLGIRQVDSEVTEAGRAFGATRFQVLKDVQLPLAMPSIMQGINQTTMMALAMVVIASMIGARGVGETVLARPAAQRSGPRPSGRAWPLWCWPSSSTASPRPMARACKATARPGIRVLTQVQQLGATRGTH